MLAKTQASGGAGLLPEVLAFTGSLEVDRTFLRQDLVGSLAHLTMLARTGILPKDAAAQLRGGILGIWDDAEKGALSLPDEEDVHMAVEAELGRRVGAVANLLHSARSRNDQVALDLRLFARERCADVLGALGALLELLVARARADAAILLPAYTHRQRAQPISLAYLLAGYGEMFARDVDGFAFALGQADVMPLGVGAIAGTSLPIDRGVTSGLLRFPRTTANGLDTVGDRDFELDFAFASTKLMLHASRLAADLVDFTSAEFGFAKLDGDIACGSSMMPQKRNPDVFELVRGKAGRAIGNLVALLTTVKGLPAGYNRDLQEDRPALFDSARTVLGVVDVLSLALPRVRFDAQRCRAALDADFTGATDVAEALVRKGVPFREAYKLVGALVRRCQDENVPLAKASAALAAAVDPRLSAEVLAAAEPASAVQRKESQGGTGPASVTAQLARLTGVAARAKEAAAAVPRAKELFEALRTQAL